MINVEKRRAQQRAWHAKNKDHKNAYARARYNPEKERERAYKRKYGLTIEAFNILLSSQGGHCFTCENIENLHVDHDHKTGKVRGILCRDCNLALGLLKDDPERIKQLLFFVTSNQYP